MEVYKTVKDSVRGHLLLEAQTHTWMSCMLTSCSTSPHIPLKQTLMEHVPPPEVQGSPGFPMDLISILFTVFIPDLFLVHQETHVTWHQSTCG